MDIIKKYSKEWFALKGSDAQMNSIKGLEAGSKTTTSSPTIMGSIFTGKLEDAEQKVLNLSENSDEIPPSTYLNAQAYGTENIFNALDADSDGIVAEREIKDVAKLNTESYTQSYEPVLSTNDLNILYENAMAAIDSSLVEDGNTTTINYANGEKSTITFNDREEIIARADELVNEDGTKTVKEKDFENFSFINSEYDANGRLTSKYEDYQGVVNDKTTQVTYNDDGSRVETLDTIGKTVVTNVDNTGNVTKSQVNVKYDIDQKIDFSQQGKNMNDCWVLGGLNSLSYSTKGQQIIKESIQSNEDGSVTVKLAGVGKSYTFSAEEIAENKYGDGTAKYAKGDTDVNLIEMAIGQYRYENFVNNEATILPFDRGHFKPIDATLEDPLNTGMTDEAVYILTGTDSQYWIDPRIANFDFVAKGALDKFQKNPDDYAMVCSFKDVDPSVTTGRIVNRHVYSIKSVNDDNVCVVNPWDSSKTITYPRDSFIENLDDLALTDLVEATTAKTLDSEKWDNKLSENIIHTLGPVDTFLRPKITDAIEEMKMQKKH